MKKLILIMLLIIAVISVNMFVFARDNTGKNTETQGFGDISGHWAEKEINRHEDLQQLLGRDGKFQPNKAITRSEFVLLLHKALKIQIMYFKAPDIGEFYNDVKNEDPYASALYDLAISNIIDFKEQFKPDEKLTREEMVHIIMSAYKHKTGENYKQVKLVNKPFADETRIDPSYSGDVMRAEHEGIIKRPANNKFYPRNAATRAQAITVIDRLLKLLEKENPVEEASQVQVDSSAEIKDGTLLMKLTITNNNRENIVIHHTSGQKFDFKLLNADREILYTWSADKLFIMSLSDTIIEPGKTVEFSEEVGKDVYDSSMGKAAYMKAYITGTSDDFSINPEGYETTVE